MKFITDKIAWTDAMKDYSRDVITNKFSNIIDNVDDVEIKLSRIKNKFIKVTLSTGSYTAQHVGNDFYATIVKVCNNLKSIIVKNKQKSQYIDKFNPELFNVDSESDFSNISDEFIIAKEKIFDLNPITTKEAILNLHKTDYPFYVYKDSKSDDKLCIVYRRYNGTLGRIICR